MKGFSINKRAIQKATQMAKEMGELRNSIRKGEGNVVGFLGELLLCEYIGGKHNNTYDSDMIDKDGIKWDVKTKERSVDPKSPYDCSVPAYNTKQACDKYAFVSITCIDGVYLRAYLLGWLSKEEYMPKARLMKKGTRDPSNGIVFKADCYNVTISQLRKFE